MDALRSDPATEIFGFSLDDVFVPAAFQGLGELLVTGLDDLASLHDVHEIRLNVVEETLVVRDQDDRHLWLALPQQIHALRHLSQRIDIEPLSSDAMMNQ